MHTPGPWKAILERGLPDEGLYIRMKADVPKSYDISMTPEDARIAEAAPKLLEALRKAKEQVRMFPYNTVQQSKIVVEIYEILDNAIATSVPETP